MSQSPALPAESPSSPHELPRVLGFVDVIGILVGTVIGSGIFIVPAAISESARPRSSRRSGQGGPLGSGALAFRARCDKFRRREVMCLRGLKGCGLPVRLTLFLVIDSGQSTLRRRSRPIRRIVAQPIATRLSRSRSSLLVENYAA
jgi:hypothetical protein